METELENQVAEVRRLLEQASTELHWWHEQPGCPSEAEIAYHDELGEEVATEIDNLAPDLLAALDRQRVEIAELTAHQKTGGDELYMALARRVFGRILATDSNADPDFPADIDLRCASIIMERDRLRIALAAKDVEIARLDETLVAWTNRCIEGTRLLKQAEVELATARQDERNKAKGLLLAAEAVVKDVRRTHRSTEWFGALAELMHAVEAYATPEPAEPQGGGK